MRHRVLVWVLAVLVAPVALAGAGAVSVAASTTGVGAKHHKRKHHKPKHHRPKHHKTTPPKTTPPKSKNQLEECTTTVNGFGPVLETNLYDYQVILRCSKGEFAPFQVSTNRTLEAGSVTAQIGSRFTYTCQTTSSTSASCTGVHAEIPPEEEGAIRLFFKSAQAPCVSGALETATITIDGETFTAKALNSCE